MQRLLLSTLTARRALGSMFLLGPLVLAGCGDSEAEPTEVSEEVSGTKPAVMVVAQVVGPDDYLTYVAAFPNVPRGDVDMSQFREFDNSNVYTFNGYVFVELNGTVTRFSVNDEFELLEGPEMAWWEYGVPESNASYTVFVSENRAYTFAPDLGVLLVWDPEIMELTDTIPMELSRPAGMETWAYDGYVAGDKVFWNVFSGSFDDNEIYPAVTVAVADAETDDPVRFIEDSRCLPGGGSYVDDKGDYYLQGGGYYGFFFAYGNVEEARTCLLRIRAGETDFDTDYMVDYEELLGSYVSDPWYHVKGDEYVVRSWDPEVPFPEDSDLFYDNSALRPVLVDLSEGSVVPYPDLQGQVGIDGVTREVDGVSYYQLSETGYVEGGNAEIVELREDGIHPRFRLDGFLLGLERIR